MKASCNHRNVRKGIPKQVAVLGNQLHFNAEKAHTIDGNTGRQKKLPMQTAGN